MQKWEVEQVELKAKIRLMQIYIRTYMHVSAQFKSLYYTYTYMNEYITVHVVYITLFVFV